ncbi:MAG: hypothetical protein MMC33_004476 [Icmadophila ericetorum]|nr:hypothetical protein [Icmadophila ericetorum]
MPSKPCLLSSEEFASLPAIPKWFRNNLQQPGRWVMNLDYLSQYGHAMVPLELTRLPSPTSSRSDNNFLRSKAPLSLFLEWTTKAEENTLDRLYLAQAPLSDLPKELQDDLPAPKFVRESGNGDIYDVNIWIGMPPTYTPLHRDPNPNLFIQLVGEKTVRLMEPAIGGEIFEASQQLLRQSNSSIFRGNEMMVGREKETLEGVVWDLPRDAESQKDGRASLSVRHQGGYEAHLKSSDGLFIPQGWWHSIKGVGDGITGSVNWWFR